MFIQFMQYSQQKNRRICYAELRRVIQEWNVGYRVEEKIVVWGIGYSIKKMKALPTEFMFEAFVYYVLKYHPSLISDYAQTILTDCVLSLKKVYNTCSIGYFKINENYNFTMVILAKLLKYFLLSAFPQLKLQHHVEAHIFISVTFIIIGYPVDQAAYDLIQLKMKQRSKHKKQARFSRSLDQTSVEVQMRRAVEKKIRRCGLNGTLATANENKQLQYFRLEIQQSLRTKIMPSPRIISEKGKRNEIKCLLSSDESLMEVSKSPQISFYQISSAMKINDGFGCAKKSPKMHLSTKKIAKKQIVNNGLLAAIENRKAMLQLHERQSIVGETQNERFPRECSPKCSTISKQPLGICESVLLTIENRISEDLPLKAGRTVDLKAPEARKIEGNQRCLPKIDRK